MRQLVIKSVIQHDDQLNVSMQYCMKKRGPSHTGQDTCQQPWGNHRPRGKNVHSPTSWQVVTGRSQVCSAEVCSAANTANCEKCDKLETNCLHSISNKAFRCLVLVICAMTIKLNSDSDSFLHKTQPLYVDWLVQDLWQDTFYCKR